MYNLKRFSLALVAVLAVTALGAGCFRVSPRVVKAPDRRQSVQVAGKTAAGSPHELGEQYETSSS